MKKLLQDQRGITHIFLVAALATLVVAGVGFAGWKVYERRNGDEAGAYRWSVVSSNAREGTIYSCRFTSSLGQQGVRYRRYNPSSKTMGSVPIAGVSIPSTPAKSYSGIVVSWAKGASPNAVYC